MRRAHLVIAGTIVGTAAVVAFPVESSHVDLPGSGASTASGNGTSAAGSTSGAASASTPTSTTPGSSVPSTSSPTTTAPPPTTTSGSRSATGTVVQDRYGQLGVTVTVAGNKITHVGIATISEADTRSASIDSYAIPQLEQQVIAADSANIDGISGATFTSDAFVQSLTSALGKLGFA